jgi:hypothetical protein
MSNDEQCSSIWCSVSSTSTEHFNFAEPEHVLEHLTLEHLTLEHLTLEHLTLEHLTLERRARALSTWS